MSLSSSSRRPVHTKTEGEGMRWRTSQSDRARMVQKALRNLQHHGREREAMVQDSIWTLVKTGRGDQLNLPYLFFQNYVNCRNQAIYTHNQTQPPIRRAVNYRHPSNAEGPQQKT